MDTLSRGLVQRPKPGNQVCGDAWLAEANGARWLFGVADGLGSGEPAYDASSLAVRTARAHRELPLVDIIERCDEALRETRGAALGLLEVAPEEHRLGFAAVGNIELRARSESGIKPIPANGIVGTNYRPPKAFYYDYQPGEWLVLHSDGLKSRFDLDIELRRPFDTAQELADRLADGFGRDSDDLTVLVVCLP